MPGSVPKKFWPSTVIFCVLVTVVPSWASVKSDVKTGAPGQVTPLWQLVASVVQV